MTDTCFDTGIVVDTLSGHQLAMAELRRAKRPVLPAAKGWASPKWSVPT